jgi:hypothetical protein
MTARFQKMTASFRWLKSQKKTREKPQKPPKISQKNFQPLKNFQKPLKKSKKI